MRERFWEEMSVNFTSASSPTMNGKMPHIQCTAEEIGEIVLLPGDPGRVAMFEDLLEDYKIVSNYREYVVGTGYYNGIKVTVCSTGIGGPSTEIAVLQLIALGAIIFGSDSGISTPADLKGKKVAVTSLGSANYFQLQAAMESAGLTIDDVQVEIVGTGAILTALTEGQVDAIVFSKLRTIELNNSGYAASEITCDQFLPSFGNVLVAGDKLVAEDPETVDGFCRALNKAIEYIIDGHVEEAVDMSIEKYAPTFAEKRDVVVQILNDVFVKTLWQSDYTKENGIGASNPEKWQALIDESKEIGNIDETFDASELLYTLAK